MPRNPGYPVNPPLPSAAPGSPNLANAAFSTPVPQVGKPASNKPNYYNGTLTNQGGFAIPSNYGYQPNQPLNGSICNCIEIDVNWNGDIIPYLNPLTVGGVPTPPIWCYLYLLQSGETARLGTDTEARLSPGIRFMKTVPFNFIIDAATGKPYIMGVDSRLYRLYGTEPFSKFAIYALMPYLPTNIFVHEIFVRTWYEDGLSGLRSKT